MSITYTYTVISADEAARCMEVVYEAVGHQTTHVGARLPYEGETLEQVVRMYAPVANWETAARSVVVPTIGATGVIEPDPEPVTPTLPLRQPITTGSQTL